MAAYNKFEDFVGKLGLAVHNLNTATLKVFLTNEAPLAADTVKADMTEITAEYGYPAGGSDIQNLYSQASGTGTMTGTDVTFTASGGSFGPFRYVVCYNDTAANDELVCWWDYGSNLTINDTGSFTVDFGASILTFA